jgi:hypothetical protein
MAPDEFPKATSPVMTLDTWFNVTGIRYRPQSWNHALTSSLSVIARG